MAKSTNSAAEAEPGRFRQLIDIFKMTAKYDRPGVALMVAAFLVPIAAAILYVALTTPGNPIMWIIMVVLGVLLGVLLFMFTLNWRAEKVAYSRLDGQKGATGAVLSSSLRGTWKTSDMPVAFNPKTQDLVFRAIGKPGVVLFTESGNAHSKKLLNEEVRKMHRILPNVPVHTMQIGAEQGSVTLTGLKGAVRRLPKKLTKAEIIAIDTRLSSLQQNQLPIPKGIDPNKARPPRSQMR